MYHSQAKQQTTYCILWTFINEPPQYRCSSFLISCKLIQLTCPSSIPCLSLSFSPPPWRCVLCARVPDSASVLVHVIKSEHPAAMQHENNAAAGQHHRQTTALCLPIVTAAAAVVVTALANGRRPPSMDVVVVHRTAAAILLAAAVAKLLWWWKVYGLLATTTTTAVSLLVVVASLALLLNVVERMTTVENVATPSPPLLSASRDNIGQLQQQEQRQPSTCETMFNLEAYRHCNRHHNTGCIRLELQPTLEPPTMSDNDIRAARTLSALDAGLTEAGDIIRQQQRQQRQRWRRQQQRRISNSRRSFGVLCR